MLLKEGLITEKIALSEQQIVTQIKLNVPMTLFSPFLLFT